MKSRMLWIWVVLLVVISIFPGCGDDGDTSDSDDEEDDEDDDDEDDDDDEPVITPEEACPSLCEHLAHCRSLKGEELGALKDCEIFCAELVAKNETITVDQAALECYELTECVDLEDCLANGTLEIDYTALCKTYCDRVLECWPATAEYEKCKKECEVGTSPDFATCVLYYEDCNEMKTCQLHAR